MTDSPAEAQPCGTGTSRHYQLTPDVAKELRSLRLSAAEWRLWSYLVTLDPFGNRFQELPKVNEIIKECRMSNATFYRALATFEQHQLFDVQPLRVAFRNLRGQRIVSRMRQNSHSCEKILMDETEFSSVRLDSHSCENRSLEPSQHKGPTSLQIYSERSDLSQIPPPAPEPREREEALLQFVAAQNRDVRSPRAYAKQCIQGDRQYWEGEFLKYRESRERANLPPPPPPPVENFQLNVLRRWWTAGDVGRVEQWIADNPGCGIAIDGDAGLVEVQP